LSAMNARILDEKTYTQEQENYIANHASIEICELCGDYFAIYPELNQHNTNNFIELAYEGYFYCQKCK